MELARTLKILHIGPHKTGSTFLQREVFPRISGVNYYGEGSIAAAWSKGMQPLPSGVPLWSSEAALGWPYPNTMPPQIPRLMALCEDLGVTHLIIFRRDYPSWIRSLYFQTLNEGGRETFFDWYTRNRDGLEDWRRLYSDLDVACKKHGLVLKNMSWSALRGDAPGSAKAIAEFLGCDFSEDGISSGRSNSSYYGEYAVRAYILLNRIVRGHVLRRAAQLLRVTPRQLIQNGRLGSLLNRMSPREIEMPEDLMMLDWLEDA